MVGLPESSCVIFKFPLWHEGPTEVTIEYRGWAVGFVLRESEKETSPGPSGTLFILLYGIS